MSHHLFGASFQDRRSSKKKDLGRNIKGTEGKSVEAIQGTTRMEVIGADHVGAYRTRVIFGLFS